MAYTNISASQTDADSPLDQTLMDALRTNLDDHEVRIGTNEAQNLQAILDDFCAVDIDTDVWILENSGVGASNPTIVSSEAHYVTPDPGTQNGVSYSNLRGTTNRMRVRLDRNHAIKMDMILKATTPGQYLACGLQDIAMTGVNASNDITDFIGIVHGSGGAANFRAVVQKAGAGTTTSGIGNSANWTRFIWTITVTGGGATLSVDLTMDGATVSGFPVSTNIPNTLTLHPVFATGGDTTPAEWLCDRFKAYWTSPPANP